MVSPEWGVVQSPPPSGGQSRLHGRRGFHWLSLFPLFASEISRVLTFIMHILSSGQLEILNRSFITPFAPAITSFDFPGWGRQPPFNYHCRTRSKCMLLSDQLHQKIHVLPSMKATSPADEWDITQSVNSTKCFKTCVHAHIDVALLINTNNLKRNRGIL